MSAITTGPRPHRGHLYTDARRSKFRSTLTIMNPSQQTGNGSIVIAGETGFAGSAGTTGAIAANANRALRVITVTPSGISGSADYTEPPQAARSPRRPTPGR